MGDPNFDVSQLPQRAASLWNAAAATHPLGHNAVHPRESAWLSVYNDWLAIPEPATFALLTDDLDQAMTKLGTAPTTRKISGETHIIDPNEHLSDVSTANGTLSNWTGTAAMAFHDHYGSHFAQMAASQYQAYFLAREALNAEAAVWQEVRRTLDDLSQDAIHQVEQVYQLTMSDFKLGLEITGAVVAVGGAIPTGGTLDVLEVVGAGVDVASTGIDAVQHPHHQDPMGLANGSIRQVFDSLVFALNKLKGHISEQEHKIIKNVSQYNKHISDNWDKHFCLPRPALADATRNNVTNEDEMGHPN